MGNLLKVASLGLFAAIGIASAVSVATHFQPTAGTSDLVSADSYETRPQRGAMNAVVLHESQSSSHDASQSPTTIRPENSAAAATDANAIWPEAPAATPMATDGIAPVTARPVTAPALMSPATPTVAPSHRASPSTEASLPPQPLSQPHSAFAADYQPLVSAHFELLRDVIHKIERTQEETTQLVSQLRSDQNRPPVPPEDVATPPPTPRTDLGPAKPDVVLRHDDTITLIFQDSDIKAVLNQIGTEAGLNILASESVSGLVSATLTDVKIDTALDAVLKSRGLVSRREGDIVYVGTHEELHFVQHGGDIIATRLYRPNYVTALDLQSLISPLLSKGSSKGGGQGSGQVTISSASEVGIASDSASAGGDSFTGEEVVMVRDFEGILAQIDQLVAEVDRMPRQVAIEAMILSVTLDDKNEMGVDFELLRQQDTLRITSGTPLIDLTAAPFSDGLKIGFLDSSVFMFLNALETIGDTNVVASPRVMCLNKQRAEILIGSELGYVSTTITETAATQSVEFLEVGTQLSIRPFISSEGMIRMEVHPELSTGSVRVESGFTLPDKEVTQVTTNVMCPNGATVVIGGLIREDLVTSSTQIPVLGNLPWVGPAFRQRREEIDRREIIVLLTPRIIEEADLWTEGQAYSDQFKDRRGVFLDKMDPLGKRHLAERHLRKARAAWAAGDVDMALRYCNMAIHFDPLDPQAIALRGELLAVAPDLETSVHDHLRHGLDPGHLPNRDYSKHGYPWQLPEHGPGVIHETPSDDVETATGEIIGPSVHTIEIGPPPATRAPRLPVIGDG